MPRGVRKTAPAALPEGVRPAKWVPLLIIPSAGSNARMDGTHLANSRRQPRDPKADTPVRLRYQPCCDEHKSAMTVSSLESPQQLHGLITRLSMHYGHGRLRADQVRLEWEEYQGKAGCADCLEEQKEKEKAA